MKKWAGYKKWLVYVFWVFGCTHIALVGCASYGDVYVAHDKYKQAKTVSLAGTHRSEETHGIGNMPKSFEVNYSKAQKPGAAAPVEMKLVFMQATEKMQLKASATVSIDSTPQEVQIVNINRTIHVSENFTRQYAWEPKDSTSYKLFGTIIFPPELWLKISSARSLAYVLIIDDLPYTFMLSPEMLEKLRVFSRQ